MLKKTLVAFAFIITTPLLVSALPDTIAAQTGATCPNLTRNLSRGMTGNDVRELQLFLVKQGHLSQANMNTGLGIFGKRTEDAVKSFQCKEGVVCSGTALTTGYGAVRSKTRAAIARVCIATSQPTPPPVCPNPPQPTLQCDGAWQKYFNQNQCHVGWTCVVTQAPQQPNQPIINRPPLISAIIGPTLLKPNVSGTWKITASDPEGDALTYSTVGGDEGSSVATLLNIAQQGTPYNATTSMSHAYANTGAYTIVVFAKDTAGNIAKATLSINVYEPISIVASCDADYKPICGQPPMPQCQTGLACAQVMPQPRTYINKCQLDAAGASFIRDGECSASSGASGSACIMNGKGYAIEKMPDSCKDKMGDGFGGTTPEECKKFAGGALTCTATGWSGPGVFLSGIKVACTSKNGTFIPGGVVVYGGGLCNGQTCKQPPERLRTCP